VVFMTFRRRVKLSEQQRNDMWRRWKAGQSLHEIGRVFGKDHVSIQFMLAQHGGIAPASRRRSPLTLTLGERENISRGIACGSSIREIARGLWRAVCSILYISQDAFPKWRYSLDSAPMPSFLFILAARADGKVFQLPVQFHTCNAGLFV
jgi:hypothetical protein